MRLGVVEEGGAPSVRLRGHLPRVGAGEGAGLGVGCDSCVRCVAVARVLAPAALVRDYLRILAAMRNAISRDWL
jgi:hypothetical protein